MNPIKTIKWWRQVFKDLRLWWIFSSITKKNAKVLEEQHKLRVDWIGRIYYVINLPEEVQTAAQIVQQSYVLQEVSKYGEVMMKLGVADIVYPEIEKIDGASAYLVVLWPQLDSLDFWAVIGRLISTAAWVLGLSFLYLVMESNFDSVITFFKNLLNG